MEVICRDPLMSPGNCSGDCKNEIFLIKTESDEMSIRRRENAFFEKTSTTNNFVPINQLYLQNEEGNPKSQSILIKTETCGFNSESIEQEYEKYCDKKMSRVESNEETFSTSSDNRNFPLPNHKLKVVDSVKAKKTHPFEFICPECNEKSATAHAFSCHMRKHLPSKHTVRKKIHLCDICGKGFTGLPSLREHSRLHTGEQPFRCEYCSKGFTKRSNLQVHIRIHTGEKPYTCKLCQRCFNHSSALKTHMKIHIGEKSHI